MQDWSYHNSHINAIHLFLNPPSTLQWCIDWASLHRLVAYCIGLVLSACLSVSCLSGISVSCSINLSIQVHVSRLSDFSVYALESSRFLSDVHPNKSDKLLHLDTKSEDNDYRTVHIAGHIINTAGSGLYRSVTVLGKPSILSFSGYLNTRIQDLVSMSLTFCLSDYLSICLSVQSCLQYLAYTFCYISRAQITIWGLSIVSKWLSKNNK